MSYAALLDEVLARMNMPQAKRDVIERTKVDSATQATGIRAGVSAPDFTLANQDGAAVHLAQELQRGPVILSFFRGSWCTFCSLHMRAWAEAAAEIVAAGARLYAIHPESIATSKAFHEELQLPFDLLADLDQSVIKAFDLQFRVHADYEAGCRERNFHISQCNADESWNLAIPGTYLIDQQGMINQAWVDHDYWQRTEAKDVLNAIAGIKRGAE